MEESCGQCVPCRVGLKQMHELLEKITVGQGTLPTWRSWRSWPTRYAPPRSAAWARRPPTRSSPPSNISATNTWSTSRTGNADAGVCAALFYAPCENACPAARGRGFLHFLHGRRPLAAKPISATCRTIPFPSPAAASARPSARRNARAASTTWPSPSARSSACLPTGRLPKGMGFAPPVHPKREKVAVVGAGPAGLACAFYLTRLGYRPVVFEALPKCRRHDDRGHSRLPPAQGQARRRDQCHRAGRGGDPFEQPGGLPRRAAGQGLRRRVPGHRRPSVAAPGRSRGRS